MGFRALRVINEDRVRPGQGFGTHRHRDMEIVSYVLEGGLAHEDSLGNGSVIVPGDVAAHERRHRRAPTASSTPRRPSRCTSCRSGSCRREEGLPPRYDQKRFEAGDKRGRLRLVASENGADGSIALRQDARMYASLLEPGQELSLDLRPDRHLWIQVLSGALDVNGRAVSAGDGLAASDETAFRLAVPPGGAAAEILAFDLA